VIFELSAQLSVSIKKVLPCLLCTARPAEQTVDVFLCINSSFLLVNPVPPRVLCEGYVLKRRRCWGLGSWLLRRTCDVAWPCCLEIVGFFLGWRGNPGRGRALGAGEVKFTGQILPTASKVVYNINMKRVIERKLVMGIADGSVSVDGREIYTASDLRVGLFQSTESF